MVKIHRELLLPRSARLRCYTPLLSKIFVSIHPMNLQTQNVPFWFRFDEKLAEKAQHTQVCEHCEGIFSFNLGQKWQFPSTKWAITLKRRSDMDHIQVTANYKFMISKFIEMTIMSFKYDLYNLFLCLITVGQVCLEIINTSIYKL